MVRRLIRPFFWYFWAHASRRVFATAWRSNALRWRLLGGLRLSLTSGRPLRRRVRRADPLYGLKNLIIVLRVSVTLLVMPTGPPLARWNAAYCS
jgi:hypothetical protein